jgi:hypothetical protein
MLDEDVDLEGSFPSFSVMASALNDVDLLSLPGYGAVVIQLAAMRGRWFTPRALGRFLFGRELCVRLRFGAAQRTEHADRVDVRPYVFRPTGQAVAAHIARVEVTWEIVETPGYQPCYEIPLVAEAHGPVVWSSPVDVHGNFPTVDVSINAVSMALGRLANMAATTAARSQIDFLRRSVENNTPWFMGDVALHTASYALARHASRFDGGAFFTYRGEFETDRMSVRSASTASSHLD